MSLYKQLGSAVWWVNITLPSRARLRKSTGETDRTKAQKRHDQFKVDLWNEPIALQGKTWGKAVNAWLDVETRSESEMLSLSKFSRVFKDRPLKDVTPEAVDKALSFCLTAGTYTRYRTMLSAILRQSDAYIKLLQRKDKKIKPRDWLTREQWIKLHAELPPHMQAMAAFAVATGLRQSNVLNLTWSRVDLERKVAWVEAEDMKADAALNIPLSKDALNVLIAQKGEHPEFVFTYRSRPVKEIKTAFISACVRAGVGKIDDCGRYSGFTWHGLRHTWATWHVQNGTPVGVLQKLGGWSDLRMVMRYSHHTPDFLASFADNAEKV